LKSNNQGLTFSKFGPYNRKRWRKVRSAASWYKVLKILVYRLGRGLSYNTVQCIMYNLCVFICILTVHLGIKLLSYYDTVMGYKAKY
jgi:hypothetical protein